MSETFKRYEQKYFLTREQKEGLEKVFETHMVKDRYCMDNDYYLIRNIYYDTEENTLIHKSVNKPVFKEKIRLRKYGTYHDGSDNYFLEIKRKYDGLVYKRRVGLTSKEVADFLNKNILPKKEGFQDNQILKELSFMKSIYKIEPKSFITYKRTAYFEKTNPEFRLTFDYDIQSRRENFSFDDSDYDTTLLNKDMYLMEVKISDTVPLWFARALSDLKIYPASYSKYGKDYKLLCMEGKEN